MRGNSCASVEASQPLPSVGFFHPLATEQVVSIDERITGFSSAGESASQVMPY